MQRIILASLAVLALLSSHLGHTNQAFAHRADVQRFIEKMVKEHGFNKHELLSVMSRVTLQPEIIASITKPYEKKDWDTYKQLFLTPQRVQGGLEFWQANHASLRRAEKRFGVPAHIIVAIIGVETLYGKNQGHYRVLDALSTLAFNYPARAAFFTKELAEYLQLCREHQVAPEQYLGSYAGAMGKPQFMPSSYRYYATDFSANAKKDLMNDNQAVIASVANYFHQHGWRLNEQVAQPAKLSGNQFRRINTHYKSASYTPQTLAAAGIRPLTALTNSASKAGLIALTTAKGPEFWLTYPNFYVITRYNTSPQYALVVYLLSQQLKNQWVARSQKFAYA